VNSAAVRVEGRYWILLALLALESALVFPGRTYLQSDTQIYIPLFEHLRDPSLLRRELILEGAHLSYTIYDEVTLALNRWTGVDFEWLLLAQQCLFRFVGAVGAFLLARACGLGGWASWAVSGVVWLGAFVYGPAIITTEYEPVPRGYAVGLAVFALGARAARWRPWLAGLALGIAVLYHAPAVWPILLVALCLRDWRLLAPVGVAAALLFLSGKMQVGVVQAQPFFSILSEEHRKIQMMRAPYNWLELWLPRYFLTFVLTGGLAVAAERRLRDILPSSVAAYFRWLPWIGVATIPLSYLFLERMGWALFPQFQPMRAMLYCHLLCQWLGAMVAMRELREGHWVRAALWLLLPLSLALRGDLLSIHEAKAIGQIVLAMALLGVCWVATQRYARMWAPALLAVPFLFAWKGDGAPMKLETPDLSATAQWARAQTDQDAMFFFPDLGRKPEPGIFRARAARAVYACWKQGGQVNYFEGYATKWHERWSQLLAKGHAAMDYEDLRARGIDLIVLTKDPPKEALPELYRSPGGAYRVYKLR
jgi:hypothetical protein